MANVKIIGFVLYRWSAGQIGSHALPNGQIDYQPITKYRHEKKNAFDPTYIHRRGKYHEDNFELSAILTPEQYYALLKFIETDGDLYLEFSATPNTIQQFPITIDSLPKCPDDLHEYTQKINFTAKSTYTTTPQYIDFSSIAICADDDEIVSQS